MFLITAAVTAALLFQGSAPASEKLQITDLKEGTGVAVKAQDLVTVEYVGTLQDGKQFDASKGRAPFTFTVGAGQVIKGWDQGLVGMKLGGKRKLVVPPSLAYGDQAIGGGVIPAKSTLIFEIELLRIDHPGEKQELKMEKLTEGKGDPAKEGDQVDIHYKLCFLNGVVAQDSHESKEPLHMVLGRTKLIPGFTQGVKDIKLGEKRKLTVPSTLGYGEKGAGNGAIPPNTTLIFEIEAVAITPKAALVAQREKDIKMLKIEDLVTGTGAEAKDGDAVEIHYTGMFPDGKKFDSSKDRGQTFKIQLGTGSVIKGFDLGINGMKVGGKRKVTIPPDLGYGAKGAGGVIPPNATLVFEIELISVNGK